MPFAIKAFPFAFLNVIKSDALLEVKILVRPCMWPFVTLYSPAY